MRAVHPPDPRTASRHPPRRTDDDETTALPGAVITDNNVRLRPAGLARQRGHLGADQRQCRRTHLRRRRRDQRRRRQLPAADRLPRAATHPDPRLPVPPGLRRGRATAQAGDRRRRQLHRRRRTQPPACPRRHQLQRRIRVLAGPRGRRAQSPDPAGRPALGRAGLDRRRLLLVPRHDRLRHLVARLRPGARPEHQLPGWLERARPRQRLVQEPADVAERGRILLGADRRRRQRLEHGRRVRRRPRPPQCGRGARQPLRVRVPVPGRVVLDHPERPQLRQAVVGQRVRLPGRQRRRGCRTSGRSIAAIWTPS